MLQTHLTLIVVASVVMASSVACRDPNSAKAREDFRSAILEDHTETVRRWLDGGLNPNEEAAEDCSTPLALAVLRGNEAIVDLLAGRGADMNAAAGPNGRTALGCVAAAEDNAELVVALVQLGAEVNVPEQDGRTPLMHAAQAGYVDTVRVLLAARADVHARTPGGATAVDLATAANQAEVVTLLVRAGARPVATAQAGEEQPTGPGLTGIITAVGNIMLGQTHEELQPMLDTGTWIDTTHVSPTRAIETRRINGAVYRLIFERDGKTGPFRLIRIETE